MNLPKNLPPVAWKANGDLLLDYEDRFLDLTIPARASNTSTTVFTQVADELGIDRLVNLVRDRVGTSQEWKALQEAEETHLAAQSTIEGLKIELDEARLRLRRAKAVARPTEADLAEVVEAKESVRSIQGRLARAEEGLTEILNDRYAPALRAAQALLMTTAQEIASTISRELRQRQREAVRELFVIAGDYLSFLAAADLSQSRLSADGRWKDKVLALLPVPPLSDEDETVIPIPTPKPAEQHEEEAEEREEVPAKAKSDEDKPMPEGVHFAYDSEEAADANSQREIELRERQKRRREILREVNAQTFGPPGEINVEDRERLPPSPMVG